MGNVTPMFYNHCHGFTLVGYDIVLVVDLMNNMWSLLFRLWQQYNYFQQKWTTSGSGWDTTRHVKMITWKNLSAIRMPYMYKSAILWCVCIKELNADSDSNLDASALQPLLEEFTVYL